MKIGEARETPVTKEPSEKRPAARCGRPRREFEGQVEERILDAARDIFLERGFEGASIEEIAEAARAGKPTIYARFQNKQGLFVAAFMRHMTDKHARLQSSTPEGATTEERLASIATAILEETLTDEGIGLIRLAVAEARNFPDIASSVARMARERGAQTVAPLLAEAAECREPGAPPASNQECYTRAARYFLDLILLPMLMRALMGESLESLHAEMSSHVAQRVDFFLAACRHGGIR